MTLQADLASVQQRVREIAEGFAADRAERQRRTTLDPADFAALADAGFTRLAVPAKQGGSWDSVPASIRAICDSLRTLAHGDPSVALVSSMHPAVLLFWLGAADAPPEHASAWEAQRTKLFGTAYEGHWWGTVTSEPGSGGDLARTRTLARLDGERGGYRLTGQKHFGSGSGITSFMITTAIPEDATEPDLFFLDVRGVPWDGSTGMKLTAPWDGHGMIATQSHAFAFEAFPATRIAWPGNLLGFAAATGGAIGCIFTAVILGVVDSAMAEARRGMERRRDSLNAYEQLEWSRACLEAWLCEQAFEGMLRAVEREGGLPRDVLYGKAGIAEMAETILARLCRIVGGGTFSRQSPFGYWYEDVRALGFLRPPWSLMYQRLIDVSLQFDS